MNQKEAWCTWGFTVQPTISDGGGHGLATARHCDDGSGTRTARYRTHGSGSSGTLTRVRIASKGTGDMAFWRTNGHLVDGSRFYCAYQTICSINRVARPYAGLKLCSYGRTSGKRCDNEVYRLNECSSGYCRLAMTHRNRQAGGDSGGPWSSGGTAYGITHGAKSYRLISRGLFTPVSPNFIDNLSVRVRTG